MTVDIKPQREAAEALTDGAFDLGLLPGGDAPGLDVTPLASSRLVVAVGSWAPCHPVRAGGGRR